MISCNLILPKLDMKKRVTKCSSSGTNKFLKVTIIEETFVDNLATSHRTEDLANSTGESLTLGQPASHKFYMCYTYLEYFSFCNSIRLNSMFCKIDFCNFKSLETEDYGVNLTKLRKN